MRLPLPVGVIVAMLVVVSLARADYVPDITGIWKTPQGRRVFISQEGTKIELSSNFKNRHFGKLTLTFTGGINNNPTFEGQFMFMATSEDFKWVMDSGKICTASGAFFLNGVVLGKRPNRTIRTVNSGGDKPSCSIVFYCNDIPNEGEMENCSGLWE